MPRSAENGLRLPRSSAEIGHGKTHLGIELTARLRDTIVDVRMIELQAREPLGVEHDRLLQNLLRSVLHLPEQPPSDYGKSVLSKQLGRELAEDVWPAVALVLGWLPTDSPQVRKLSAAPSALRSAAAQAAGEALHKLAETRPVCCIIDDAHYADETTLDALEYATLAEHAGTLWVCVLADPIFDRARPSWATRAADRLELKLLPLAAENAAALCRRLLLPATNIPIQIIDRLIEWTGGNPLLLTELVAAVKRRGLIRRHARGDSWYLATDELENLPELPQVEWLAERELGALSEELASSARLAALLGSDLTVDEVEGVLRELEEDGLGQMFPLDAWVSVSRLLGQGLLIARPDGHFEFRHALIRDMVVRSTPTELRRQIHRAAFRYYRNAPTIGIRYLLRQLAWHAEHSGLLGAAAATYIHLAEQAQARHEYLDAELMYSHALDLMPPYRSPARMKCFNGRGLMHYRLSRFADALADLEKAMAIADHLDDPVARTELLLDQATVCDWMWDLQSARSFVERAQTLATELGSDRINARLSYAMGQMHFRINELDTAKKLLQNAVASATDVEDQGYETLVVSLNLLGTIFSIENEVEQASGVFGRAIDLCEARGDKLHLAVALNNRHALWVGVKNVERAVEDGVRAQRLGREIGQSMLEYTTAYNLAELYYFANDLDQAWPHLNRAAEIEPSNSSKPHATLLRARLLCQAGRDEESRKVLQGLRVAQSRAREAGNKDALLDHAEELLCEMLDLALVKAELDKWQDLRSRAKDLLLPVQKVELLEVMALTASSRGDQPTATSLLDEALALSRELSISSKNASMRDSMSLAIPIIPRESHNALRYRGSNLFKGSCFL